MTDEVLEVVKKVEEVNGVEDVREGMDEVVAEEYFVSRGCIRGKQRDEQGCVAEVEELTVDVAETVMAMGESTIEVGVAWVVSEVESTPKRRLRKFCRLT